MPALRAGTHQQRDRVRRAIELHGRRPGQRRPALDQGTVQRQLQMALQLGTDELAHVGGERAAGMEQVTAGRLRQMQHLVRLIHEQARRTDFLQQPGMRLLQRAGFAGRAGGHRPLLPDVGQQ